jgi:hypothetical protein
MTRFAALTALALVCFGSLGCRSSSFFESVGVKPWERDALARRDMAWDPDPLEAELRSHIYFAKEASLQGSGAGGGGCGCN